MEDLDLEVIEDRTRQLVDWRAELIDTRLSDAPFVSVVVEPPAFDERAVAQLRAALANLPRMRASVWRRAGPEEPLETINVAMLNDAAER